jgi:hypothetical protein
MKKLIMIILILGLFLVSACEYPQSYDEIALPTNATVTNDLGNGWLYFTLDGKKYLYHKSKGGGGHRGYECITQVQ